MKNQTKITLQALLARKEQMLESKKKKKKAELFIKSLDGTITIEAPDGALAKEAQEMDERGDNYLVYQCVVEPCLKSKELQQSFGVVEPLDIVDAIFEPGEIPQIAVECIKLSGYIDGVKLVDEIKN